MGRWQRETLTEGYALSPQTPFLQTAGSGILGNVL